MVGSGQGRMELCSFSKESLGNLRNTHWPAVRECFQLG